MATLISSQVFHEIEFEPLALLTLPLDAFKRAGAKFERGIDDLDGYEYAAFELEDGSYFVLFHYDNQPRSALDLFVPRGSISTSFAPVFLNKVADEFEIAASYFTIRGSLDEPFVSKFNGGGAYDTSLPIVPVPVIAWAEHRHQDW